MNYENKSELYNLPKDVLIKIICDIERETERKVKKDLYDRYVNDIHNIDREFIRWGNVRYINRFKNQVLNFNSRMNKTFENALRIVSRMDVRCFPLHSDDGYLVFADFTLKDDTVGFKDGRSVDIETFLRDHM